MDISKQSESKSVTFKNLFKAFFYSFFQWSYFSKNKIQIILAPKKTTLSLKTDILNYNASLQEGENIDFLGQDAANQKKFQKTFWQNSDLLNYLKNHQQSIINLYLNGICPTYKYEHHSIFACWRWLPTIFKREKFISSYNKLLSHQISFSSGEVVLCTTTYEVDKFLLEDINSISKSQHILNGIYFLPECLLLNLKKQDYFWHEPWAIYVLKSCESAVSIFVMHNGKVILQRYVEIEKPRKIFDELEKIKTHLNHQEYIFNFEKCIFIFPETYKTFFKTSNQENNYYYDDAQLLSTLDCCKKKSARVPLGKLKRTSMHNRLIISLQRFMPPIIIVLCILLFSLSIKNFFISYEKEWVNNHLKKQTIMYGKKTNELSQLGLFKKFLDTSKFSTEKLAKKLDKAIEGITAPDDFSFKRLENTLQIHLNFVAINKKKLRKLKITFEDNIEELFDNASWQWQEKPDSVILDMVVHKDEL